MNQLCHTSVSRTALVRRLNEDSLLVLPDAAIYVVSDGAGGHAAGDFASQTVVDTVAQVPPGLTAGAQITLCGRRSRKRVT